MCQLSYAALHQLCSQSVMPQNNDDSWSSKILIYYWQLSELWSVKWDKKAKKIYKSIYQIIFFMHNFPERNIIHFSNVFVFFMISSRCGFCKRFMMQSCYSLEKAAGLLPGDRTDHFMSAKVTCTCCRPWIVMGVIAYRTTSNPRHPIRTKQSSTSEPKANHSLSR